MVSAVRPFHSIGVAGRVWRQARQVHGHQEASALLPQVTTVEELERLMIDQDRRRSCDFPFGRPMRDDGTFSRAVEKTVQERLTVHVHGALFKKRMGGKPQSDICA